MPTVTKLTPASGTAAGGTPVVVNGDGLNLASSVTVGGTPVRAQVVSDIEIHLTTPAHAPGPADVVVTAGGQTSTPNDASTFLFIPGPVIESIEANDWSKPDARVTIRGSHLTGASAITFNGRPAIGIHVNEAGTEVRASRPPGLSGDTAVVLTTPSGASAPYHVWFMPDASQRVIFIVQLVYVGLLVGGLIAYVTWTGFRGGLPHPLTVVPLGVAWSGALGAVTLSISGLVFHRDNWDRSYIYWHLSRPVIGAVMGSFAYLIIAAGVLASGGNPGTTPATASAGFHVNNLFYFVAAFLVGYREDTFRTLLQRVSDVLLGPGQSGGSGTSGSAARTTSGTGGAPSP